jgi:hypothetical protein
MPNNSHRRDRKSLIVLELTMIMSLLTLTLYSPHRSMVSKAAGTSAQAKRNQELSRLFKKPEIVRLDASATARQVRESGRLTLVTQSGRFDLNLTQHDLRAHDYRAEEVRSNGTVQPVEIGSVHTYKGTVEGMNKAQARFTISNESIEGVIFTETANYYIEPAKRFSASADASEFVFYKPSDLADDLTIKCGVTIEDKITALSGSAVDNLATVDAGVTALGRVVAIATEADFEYVRSLGGSQQANNEILGILNVVEGLYEEELGLSFQVTFQHTWATASDPYTTTENGSQLLSEFQSHWNMNFQNVVRDLAHIWTGKNAGGIAFINSVCRTTSAYGLTSGGLRNALTTLAFVAQTPTHEIGHNFGALHPDQQTPPVTECAGTIMQSIQGRDLTFCPFSRSQITAYVNASGGCLVMSSDTCATLTLSATDVAFGPNAGTSAFRVDALPGCSWTALTNVNWITITSGGGIGSGVVNYSVSANSGGAVRVGTITVGGRTLTISQDSASCVSLPLPLSWWRAEGNVHDSVGPNHGKLLGTVTFATGRVGQAFRFINQTTLDDYLYAPTTNLPRGNNDMTVEFWYSEGGTASQLSVWFEEYTGGTTGARYTIGLSRFGALLLGDNQTSLSGNFESADPLQWHHVAVTNQGNSCILYLDGKVKASGNVQINLPQSTAFYIGRNQKGFVDEVSVHNRAISLPEIQAIFAAGNAGKCGAMSPTVLPTLLTAGNTTRAIALDSVTFIRDPLPLSTVLNFSPDQRTRVMLFASNLELLPSETGSVVTAEAEDSQHRIYPLTVEFVGKVPNLDWLTQVNVRLPDELANGGDVLVTFRLRGAVSNKALITIRLPS